MRYRGPSVDCALAQIFGSGRKQVIPRHVLFVARKSCKQDTVVEVEAEVVSIM